ncbi:MAG: Fic family protein [Nitrospinaceae bacterium]|nr:Fic family protein [Nitrospinaceae bacterium]NIR57015.1 Fic family protein [Nitrospinaceae bacterium]NIU98701.1 Fic family protein [Nitrospinaceae bacterium]NIW08069.1 Fic family protein [Nitrospinaceae bacterium]NIW61254.1 Fic family protein [Nitrospinaceae bacterium]
MAEAQSKCDHIAGVPLRPREAAYLHRVYMIKGLKATTAIEGNTLTEEEISRYLDGKLELPDSQKYLTQEVENIKIACEGIIDQAVQGEALPLNLETIFYYNRLVLEGLKLNKDVVPGKIREYSVGVFLYRGAPAEDCRYLLERLCEWLNSDQISETALPPISSGLIKAILAHLYLAWIHPFGDGNGRTARLLEYQLLIGSGVPTPAAHLLSNHYNLTRDEYYRQLEYASVSGGDVLPFIEYALKGFIDGLKEQLKIIKQQQWDVAWRNYIHEKIKGSSSALERCRYLVLDLSFNHDIEFVAISKLKEISPRVARAYAGKPKAIFYDLKKLEKWDLIERKAHKVRAKKEKILAFLPDRASS